MAFAARLYVAKKFCLGGGVALGAVRACRLHTHLLECRCRSALDIRLLCIDRTFFALAELVGCVFFAPSRGTISLAMCRRNRSKVLKVMAVLYAIPRVPEYRHTRCQVYDFIIHIRYDVSSSIEP